MRLVYFALGWASLVTAIVGAFLPVIPTTPLVLLAACFFSKSSRSLHQRILHHGTFGPVVREWEMYRVIRPRAKWASTIVMLPVFAATLLFVDVGPWVKGCVAALGAYGLYFVWSKPSRVPPDAIDGSRQ